MWNILLGVSQELCDHLPYAGQLYVYLGSVGPSHAKVVMGLATAVTGLAMAGMGTCGVEGWEES